LENVSPFNYEVLSGNDPMLLIGVLCFAAGIAVVIFLHWIFDSKRVHDSRAQK